MGALTVPPARRRPAVPSCMGIVHPKANTQPKESVQQVRAGGCGYRYIYRYISIHRYIHVLYTHGCEPTGRKRTVTGGISSALVKSRNIAELTEWNVLID